MEEAEARARVAASYPEIEIGRLVRLGAGWDSEAWLADGNVVFRFNHTPDGANQIRKEARLLPAIAPLLPAALPLPRYIATDDSGREHSFSAYDFIAGEPGDSPLVDAASADAIATQLGAFLTALHSVPLETARDLIGESDPAIGSPWLLRERWRVDVFPIFDAEERVAIEDRWDQWMKAMELPAELALIHGDLSTQHVLVDPDTGKLNGIIDWGDATIGDRALDFAGFEPPLRRHVLAAYSGEVDATFLTRVDFYRWLGPLHEIAYGLYTGGGQGAVDRGTRQLLDSLGLP